MPSKSQILAIILMVARRPSDTLEDFLRRRERIVTASLKKYSRGVWGQTQRYICFTFHGHIARLQSGYHMATQSLCGEDPDGGRPTVRHFRLGWADRLDAGPRR